MSNYFTKPEADRLFAKGRSFIQRNKISILEGKIVFYSEEPYCWIPGSEHRSAFMPGSIAVDYFKGKVYEADGFKWGEILIVTAEPK